MEPQHEAGTEELSSEGGCGQEGMEKYDACRIACRDTDSSPRVKKRSLSDLYDMCDAGPPPRPEPLCKRHRTDTERIEEEEGDRLVH